MFFSNDSSPLFNSIESACYLQDTIEVSLLQQVHDPGSDVDRVHREGGLELRVLDAAVVLGPQEQREAVGAEGEDQQDEDELPHRGECSRHPGPNLLERPRALLLLLHVEDGLALEPLGGPDVLVVEEAGGDVVVEVGRLLAVG